MQPAALRFQPCSGLARGRALIFSSLAPAILWAAPAQARPPRSERVLDRVAERAYARMSIAEARAARAGARVAEIAPVVPVPPPPRPATVRRMRRAGVPVALAGQPALIVTPADPSSLPAAPPAVVAVPPTTVAPKPESSQKSIAAAAPPEPASPSEPAADIASDGTRSVLASNEELLLETGPRGPALTAEQDPPIELLPTPQPE
jgi:hypothetical protein